MANPYFPKQVYQTVEVLPGLVPSPESAAIGSIAYNDTTSQVFAWDGVAWAEILNNWFNADLTQTANRIHNQASFTTTVANVNSLVFDRAAAGTLENFVRFNLGGFTVERLTALNNSTFDVTSTDITLTATDGAATSLFHILNSGETRLDSSTGTYLLGDGAGANLPPDEAAPTHFLTIDTTTGAIEKSTIAVADLNLANDNLTWDADRTHDQAGFNNVVNNVDVWTIDRGAGTLLNFMRLDNGGLDVRQALGANTGRIAMSSVAWSVTQTDGTNTLALSSVPVINTFEIELSTGTSLSQLQLNGTEVLLFGTNGTEISSIRALRTGRVQLLSTIEEYILGDGAGANLPPDEATPDNILGVMNANGQIVKSTPAQLTSAGGGLVRELTINEYDVSEAVAATAAGQKTVVIPASMNGMNLVDVTASVRTLGTSAGAETIDVNVIRGRAAVTATMLSGAVTLLTSDYFSDNGTVDVANDDVQTGDRLFLSIVNNFTLTDPMGLTVTLTFELP